MCLGHLFGGFFWTEKFGVVFKDIGENVTIQCRTSAPRMDSLEVKRCLLKNEDVFSTRGTKYKDNIISNNFKDRLKFDISDFPNVDIKLSRLAENDTAIYRCEYIRVETKPIREDGNGSVLLVVKGEASGSRAVIGI